MKHTVTEIKLNNGAKGLFIHVPNASVMSLEINFRAGEYLVPAAKWEVPHLMEHVLLGANELLPRARDFQTELEKNGAYSNASTSTYDITYEAECADFEWDRVLGLLLIAISKPLFLEDEFKAEYGNVQEEMAARANNHFRRLSIEMRRAAGLLAKPDLERLELISNVNLKDIRLHHRRTHTSPNMRFIIAGDLKSSRRDILKELLENIELPKTGRRYDLPVERPRSITKPIYIENETVENLYFYIDTYVRHRLTDDQTDALNLLNTLLTETLYSKILGTAREKGLVYGMNSASSQTRSASNWWFGAQVSDKNAPALFHIIINELGKVLGGEIYDHDIELTKQYALGRFQRSAQTVFGTAAGYAGRYFFEDIIDDYYRVPARIRAVTKDTMVEVARTMFKDNVWGFGVLGNCGSQYVDSLQRLLYPLWPLAKKPELAVDYGRAN